MLLDSLLPAVAELSPEMIDLDQENIDGISLLGRSVGLCSNIGPLILVFSQAFCRLGHLQTADAALPRREQPHLSHWHRGEVTLSWGPLTSHQVASLGQLLCGLTTPQWTSLVTPQVFQSTLTDHLSRLDCSVHEDVRSHLAALLLAFYGPDTDTWTASDLLSTGWLAASLPPRLFFYIVAGSTTEFV